MQFVLMNYTQPGNHKSFDDIAAGEDGELWGAYTKALIEAGVMLAGEALHAPSTATTVRVSGGERELHDGPYADTKEQLGGFYVIDVPDLDTALMWAARSPAAAKGAVEVRPLIQRG